METKKKKIAEEPEEPMIGICSEFALKTMRERGGTWAVYQNMALDSSLAGHYQFLKVGDGCTYLAPPTKYPMDTSYGTGWKYLYRGMLNLSTGLVEKEQPELPSQSVER